MKRCMEKIRVLYVESTLESGGPTTQLYGIISNLDKMKFEPCILTLSQEPSNSSRKKFMDLGVEIKSLNLNRMEFIAYGKLALKRKVTEFNPHIIHTSGLRADGAISKMKLKYPHCLTVHNYVFDDYIRKYGIFVGRIAAYYGLSAIRNCNYAICCSQTLEKMYSNLLNKKMYSIQNGVDIDKFTSINTLKEKNRLRSELNIPEDKIIFLVVGKLINRKDPMVVIRAFKQAEVSQNATLILLGDGELYEECKKLENDSIKVLGNVSDVCKYLRAGDVYISASHSEGLPYSVLEAGSCGMDMILSSIPQHREIFEDKPDLIQYFEVGNMEKLSAIIRKNIDNHKSLNKVEISKYIRDRFSDKAMSTNYERMYNQILSGEVKK